MCTHGRANDAKLKNHLLIWTDNNRTCGSAFLENWWSVAQIINITCLTYAKKQPRPQAKSRHPIEFDGWRHIRNRRGRLRTRLAKKKVTTFEPPRHKQPGALESLTQHLFSHFTPNNRLVIVLMIMMKTFPSTNQACLLMINSTGLLYAMFKTDDPKACHSLRNFVRLQLPHCPM